MNLTHVNMANTIIYDFVWNGKRPKISKDLLMRDKMQGGLRLVNITLRQCALKCQWVTKLTSNLLWSKICYSNLIIDIGELIWKCNLSVKHVKLVLKEPANSFWVDVLESWCMYNFNDKAEDIDVMNQCIWFNSNICIENKPFILQKAWQSGIIFLNDILNSNGSMKSFAVILEEFPNSLNWLQYAQIADAIPNEWRVRMRNGEMTSCLNTFDRINNCCKVSNLIYHHLIDSENCLEKRKSRWEHKLGFNISYKEFIKCFRDLYLHTICTKYRNFQYKLLTGTIITNRLLLLWKIKDTELCSFCKRVAEDDVHLFVRCNIVRNLWSDVKMYIKNNDRQNVYDSLNWSDANIIFSTVHNKPLSAINLLITVAKFYIYQCRCSSTKPVSNVLINQFEQVFRTECKIAFCKNKFVKHCAKWSVLQPVYAGEGNSNYISNYLANL